MKILPKDITRTYELTFLLPHSYTTAETQKAEGSLKEVLKKHSLKLVSEDDWGKHQLEYTLIHSGTRHTSAQFKHWIISGKPSDITDFEASLKLDQLLLRTLLVRQSDEKTQFGAPAAQEKSA